MTATEGGVERALVTAATLVPFVAALVLGSVALSKGVVLTLDEGFVVEPTRLGTAAAALSVASLVVGAAAVRAYTTRRGEPPWSSLLPEPERTDDP